MDRNVVVSGCYIVRDEQDVLAASLAAAAPFVDEIVVYDTGSVDDTVRIARDAGARVVEGFWDDDFGAARNRALEHCRGRWIVSIDADETLAGEPRAFRKSLWDQTLDMFTVEVRSDSWAQVGRPVLSMANRVFRRDRCRWEGRLHEQVVTRRGQVRTEHQHHLVIEHHGYTAERFATKDKGRRNLDVSLAALAAALERHDLSTIDKMHSDVARSAVVAGDLALAAEHFALIDRTRAQHGTVVSAARSAVPCLTDLGLVAEAAGWIDSLRAIGESVQLTAFLSAHVAKARGDLEEAVRLLTSLEDDDDFYGLAFSRWAGAPKLIECLIDLHRLPEAAGVTLDLVATGESNLAAVQVLQIVAPVEGGLERLVDTLGPALIVQYLGELHSLPAGLGDSFAEVVWTRGQQRAAVLVWAAAAWSTSPVERLITWSLRLREAGLARECPLRRAFADPTSALQRRVLAGSVLMEIGEEDVADDLGDLLGEVEDVEATLVAIARHAPTFAARLVPA